MDIDIDQTQIEPKPQEKFIALQRILPDANNNPNLVISGSLSQKISFLEKDGKCHLNASDLSAINDIDLISLEYERGRYDRLARDASQPNFFVECKVQQSFSYNTRRGQELSEKEIELEVDTGQTYHVRITTPEYLLLTRVKQSGGGHRDKGKVSRRITELQHMPSFSRDRFIELAHLELKVTKEMNEKTFKLWQMITNEDPQEENEKWEDFLERKSKDFPSIVDQARLHSLAKSKEDIIKITLNDIKPISNLERFLDEYINGEEIDN